MAKYKKIVNENIVDNIIGSIFRTVGKGLRSAAINKISKKDPEFAKKMKDLEKSRKELDDYLSKNVKNRPTKSDRKAVIRGDFFDVSKF
jgi:hypothetical protein